MKKLLAVLTCVSMTVVMLSGCGSTGAETVAPAPEAESQAEEAAEEPDAAGGEESQTVAESYKVGFAIKTLEGAFFVKLGEAVDSKCAELGWECTTLNADRDIQKEAENIETFVAQGVDIILLDCVDPSAAVASVATAKEAGIPVIAVDAGVDEAAEVITTVYSNNKETGRRIGLAYAEKMQDAPIKAIMLSGAKGDVVGFERRFGLFCGIIEGRTDMSEDEAWEAAQAMEDELISGGKAVNGDADFTIVGQGWGGWTEDGGLDTAEDFITANKDINCVMTENDQMAYGAGIAVKNAGLEGVDLVSTADGEQKAYDLIKEGEYFATGENSPAMVIEMALDVAGQVLRDGKTDFDPVIMTEAVAITKDNVEERYEYGF